MGRKKEKDGYRGRWCVTGINRLTGEREAVTLPCQEEQARQIFEREKSKRARKRAYIYLKLEKSYRKEKCVQLQIFK